MQHITFTNNTSISALANPVNNSSFNDEYRYFNDMPLAKKKQVIESQILRYHPSIKWNITYTEDEISITAHE